MMTDINTTIRDRLQRDLGEWCAVLAHPGLTDEQREAIKAHIAEIAAKLAN